MTTTIDVPQLSALTTRLEAALAAAQPLPTRPAHAHTVRDLLTHYLRAVLPTKAPKTMAHQRSVLGWWQTHLGDLPLAALTPAVLRQWRDTLSQTYQPGTVRVYLDGLSAALTVAVDELEWLTDHPMRKVRKLRSPPGGPGFSAPRSPGSSDAPMGASRW